MKTIENGFRILLSDSNVKVVFVNIFGGIVRCDRVAEGIIQAAGKIGVYLPFVIRLSGTNAQEAAKIIKQSPVPFSMAPSMEKASELVMDILAGEQS
ncbi:MAG: hypothetical protein U5R06_02695 [candidate division KSB1 bacterium]|nr:hypothetical protein [candidate division KSB1 bacterium]